MATCGNSDAREVGVHRERHVRPCDWPALWGTSVHRRCAEFKHLQRRRVMRSGDDDDLSRRLRVRGERMRKLRRRYGLRIERLLQRRDLRHQGRRRRDLLGQRSVHLGHVYQLDVRATVHDAHTMHRRRHELRRQHRTVRLLRRHGR